MAVVRLTQRAGGDGGHTRLTRGDFPASATVGQVDRPGRRLGVGANNSIVNVADRIYYGRVGAGAWSSSASPWQVWIEPMVDPNVTIAGSPIAQTTQRSQRGRAVGGLRDRTISGLLSGKHPDISNHNGTQRGDGIGFCVESSSLNPGDAVGFMLSLGFAPPFAFPGTKGAFCLRPPLLYTKLALVPPGQNFVKCLIRAPVANYPTIDIFWQALVIRNGQLFGFSTAACQRL